MDLEEFFDHSKRCGHCSSHGGWVVQALVELASVARASEAWVEQGGPPLTALNAIWGATGRLDATT